MKKNNASLTADLRQGLGNPPPTLSQLARITGRRKAGGPCAGSPSSRHRSGSLSIEMRPGLVWCSWIPVAPASPADREFLREAHFAADTKLLYTPMWAPISALCKPPPSRLLQRRACSGRCRWMSASFQLKADETAVPTCLTYASRLRSYASCRSAGLELGTVYLLRTPRRDARADAVRGFPRTTPTSSVWPIRLATRSSAFSTSPEQILSTSISTPTEINLSTAQKNQIGEDGGSG